MLYYLLSGMPPFPKRDNQSEEELKKKICTASFNFNDPAWDTISDEGKRT